MIRGMFLLCVLAALLCFPTMAESEEASSLTPSEAAGKAHFDRLCYYCHAKKNFTGAYMLGKRLGPEENLIEARSDLDADYVTNVVRGGLNSMPWFTRVELTDRDLEELIGYLTRPKADAKR